MYGEFVDQMRNNPRHLGAIGISHLTKVAEMFPPSQSFEGYLSLIVLQVSNINAATEITLRVCRDQEGDQMIITDTISDLYTGITTATKGSAIFALNSFVKVDRAGDLFVFLKTDTGTVDLDYVEMTYQGDR